MEVPLLISQVCVLNLDNIVWTGPITFFWHADQGELMRKHCFCGRIRNSFITPDVFLFVCFVLVFFVVFYILLLADLWNLIWLQSTSCTGDTGSFKTPAFVKILCMLSAWVVLSEIKDRIKETSCSPLKLWWNMSSNCRQAFHCCLPAIFSSGFQLDSCVTALMWV